VTDRDEIAAKLPAALETEVRKEGALDDKVFILTRLTDVALARRRADDAESSIILEIAKELEVPTKIAYSIIVGSAQSIGFRTGREAGTRHGRGHPPLDDARG